MRRRLDGQHREGAPFDAATTALFRIGSYQYDIYLEDGKRTTINAA